MSFRCVAVSILLSIVAATAFAGLNLPPDMTAEATGPGGATVEWRSSITDGPDDENGRPLTKVTCSHASNSLFPIGTTTVTCSASNGMTGSFNVTVVDSTGPNIATPHDFTLYTTEPSGTIAQYDSLAFDLVDGGVSVNCSPSSGSLFPVGVTSVTCSSSDSRFNTASETFFVTVILSAAPPPPPPPPPSDITAEATGPNGAHVNFAGNGLGDDFNGRPIGNCSPASGSLFPLGTTTVTCSNGPFQVHVVDTTPPALALPMNMFEDATNSGGSAVLFSASALDVVDGDVAVSCAPPSGSIFPLGTTTVSCTASDSRSNTATGTFDVTILEPVDTTAPDIHSITATPNTLWPANGALVPIAVTVTATDAQSDNLVIRIYDVTANETMAAGDWQLTGDLALKLRATRDSQGPGRTYKVYVEVLDEAGNRAVGTVDVVVPHDQGNTSAGTTPAPAPSKRRSARGG